MNSEVFLYSSPPFSSFCFSIILFSMSLSLFVYSSSSHVCLLTFTWSRYLHSLPFRLSLSLFCLLTLSLCVSMCLTTCIYGYLHVCLSFCLLSHSYTCIHTHIVHFHSGLQSLYAWHSYDREQAGHVAIPTESHSAGSIQCH